MNCLVCGIELTSDKKKTCSPRCRVALSRQGSVTANGSVTAQKAASVTFSFKLPSTHTDSGFHEWEEGKPFIRETLYWYDVPLGAVPVYQKGWPEKPEYMNGRQYFLWWKNEFKTNDDPSKGEIGQPVILNPLPERDNIRYQMGGKESRMWGA